MAWWLLLGLASPAQALTEQQTRELHEAAKRAGDQCLHQMHHDTDEFSACVDQALAQAGAPATHLLGYAYLGLVGCLSADRMATLHARDCSLRFLRLADGWQRQLKVSDSMLCQTVPGNCTIRLAQIQALRGARVGKAAAPARPASAAP